MIPGEQIQHQTPSKPGQLIAAFVIGLIGSSFELVLGILWFSSAFIISNIIPVPEFANMIIQSIGTVIGIVYIIPAAVMLLLWIFAFMGKNGARIALIVIISIDLLLQLLTFNLISLILDIILVVLLSSRSVSEYCSSRYQQYEQVNYNPIEVSETESAVTADNRTIPLVVTPKSFAVLIAESGPLRGQTFKLVPKSSYVIGRAGDITIPEEDKTTSREHARVRDENGNFVIYDMGSTNHIYINGEKADRKVLLDGDKIKIGQNVFRFQMVRGK